MSAFLSFSLEAGRSQFDEAELLQIESRAYDLLNAEYDSWASRRVAQDALAMVRILRKTIHPPQLKMAPGSRLRLASARTGRRRSARGSKQKNQFS